MGKKLIFICFIFLTALKAFSQIVPNVSISTMSKTVDAIYKPVNKRDPMLQSFVYKDQTAGRIASSSEQKIKVSTSTSLSSQVDYSLIGIVQFEDRKEALLRDSEGKIYFVRDGNLYDNKKNIVKGVKAYIKGKQITILKDGHPPVEIYIKGGE